MSEPDILYHYCSLDTFFNIIKNRSLWLSDISKSNDSQELLCFKEGVQSAISDKFSEYIDSILKKSKELESNPKEALDFMKSKEEHQEAFKRILDTYKMEQSFFMNTWGICFSEEGDLLSQWRGYADDAKGVSIGFSKEKLGTSFKEISKSPFVFMKLGKVYYTKEYVIDIIKNKTNLDSINLETTPEQINDILCETLSIVTKEGPFYKGTSFSEEKEWRLAITDMFPIKYNRKSYLNILKKANTNLLPLEIKDWNYIIKQDVLVSYIELYLHNIKDAVSSIIIGPKSKCTTDDIRDFLIFHGLLKDDYDNSIEVKKSESSYR